MSSIHYHEAVRVFEMQLAAIGRVRDQLIESFDAAVETILRCRGKVVITGLGKSGIIGQKIAATLSSTGTSSVFMNAADALHGDLGMVSDGDCVVMVSNSGETIELIRMLPSLRRYRTSLIGILGKAQSSIGRECHVVLNVEVGREACPMELAPTSSSTACLVTGDALACALLRAKGFSQEQFAVNHPGGSLGRRLLLKARDVMPRVSEWPLVRPEATVREIAIVMTQISLGAVCVTVDGRLEGIVTDGDLRRHLAVSDDLTVRAETLMTRHPATASPDDSVDTLLKLMESPERKIYVLPVIDADRRFAGLVRMHDVLSG